MHFKLVASMLLMQVDDSLTDVLKVVNVLWLQDELGNCLSGCLKQLVSNTKTSNISS